VRFSGSISFGGGVEFSRVSVLGIGSKRDSIVGFVSGAVGPNSGTNVLGGKVFSDGGVSAGLDGVGSNGVLVDGVVVGTGLRVVAVVCGTGLSVVTPPVHGPQPAPGAP
jgi:hypothetical protein